MNRSRHIIWDWNGTLLDDIDACVWTLNQMLARRNLSPVNCDSYRKIFDFPVKAYYEKLGFDFGQEDWDANAMEFITLFRQATKDARLRKGCVDVLQHFRAAHVPMSVLSATESALLTNSLRHFSIDDFFQEVCARSDFYASSKIEQGRQLVDSLGMPPADILFVGDTTHDYEVATALGCSCLLVAGGHNDDDRLYECKCPVVSELPDVVTVLRTCALESSVIIA